MSENFISRTDPTFFVATGTIVDSQSPRRENVCSIASTDARKTINRNFVSVFHRWECVVKLSYVRNRFSLYIYSELYIRTRYRLKRSYFNEMKFSSEKRHLRICCFVTVRSESPSLQDKGKAYFYITFSITSYTVVNIQDSTYDVSSLFDCNI